jgi:hypothetical protein
VKDLIKDLDDALNKAWWWWHCEEIE